MTTRTTTKTLVFTQPFVLTGIDGAQPAGSYVVETDEELLQDVSFPAYRRLATWIRLPLPHGRAGSCQTPVDPVELDAALAKDGVTS